LKTQRHSIAIFMYGFLNILLFHGKRLKNLTRQLSLLEKKLLAVSWNAITIIKNADELVYKHFEQIKISHKIYSLSFFTKFGNSGVYWYFAYFSFFSTFCPKWKIIIFKWAIYLSTCVFMRLQVSPIFSLALLTINW
jgi:hypothetical protein